MAKESIKLTHAALDDGTDGDIVLRGVIDPASLSKLQVADYQREILPISHIRELSAAIRSGQGIPDIQLGMRGGSYLERDNNFYLQDDVFIVDGLQRRTAALEVLKSGELPRLGATVHFNTTEESERALFRSLNVQRVRLSPNVLLRNDRYRNSAIEMLFHLSADSSFVLHNRVSWQQRMKRNELMTAVGLLRISAGLHRRFGQNLVASNHGEVAEGFNKMLLRIGRNTVRNNIKLLFDVIDGAFNLRSVTYKDGAPHLRQGFQSVLVKMFASYKDFWDDTLFRVEADLRRKLSLFPLSDPHVINLCSTSGPGQEILYSMLVKHMNSGKRTRRLQRFEVADAEDETVDSETEE